MESITRRNRNMWIVVSFQSKIKQTWFTPILHIKIVTPFVDLFADLLFCSYFFSYFFFYFFSYFFSAFVSGKCFLRISPFCFFSNKKRIKKWVEITAPNIIKKYRFRTKYTDSVVSWKFFKLFSWNIIGYFVDPSYYIYLVNWDRGRSWKVKYERNEVRK